MKLENIQSYIFDCCDKCCDNRPNVVLKGKTIEVFCKNCGDSAEHTILWKVVCEWNHRIRKKLGKIK